MKKFMIFLLVTILCVTPLTGCIIGGDEPNTSDLNWYSALEQGLTEYRGAFDTRFTKKVNDETQVDLVLAIRTNDSMMKMRLDQYGSADESLYGVVQDDTLYISAPKLFTRALNPIMDVSAAYNGAYFTTPLRISANANNGKKTAIMTIANAINQVFPAENNQFELSISDNQNSIAFLEAVATAIESTDFKQAMLTFETASQSTVLLNAFLGIISSVYQVDGSTWTDYANSLRSRANAIANNELSLNINIKIYSDGTNLNFTLDWTTTENAIITSRSIHTIFTPVTYSIGGYDFKNYNDTDFMPISPLMSHIAFELDSFYEPEEPVVQQLDSIPTYNITRNDTTVVCERITPLFTETITYYIAGDSITNIEAQIQTNSEVIKRAFELKYFNEGFENLENPLLTSEILITPEPTPNVTPAPSEEPTDNPENTDDEPTNTMEPTVTNEPTEAPTESPTATAPAPTQSGTFKYTLTFMVRDAQLQQWNNAFDTIDQLVYALSHK